MKLFFFFLNQSQRKPRGSGRRLVTETKRPLSLMQTSFQQSYHLSYFVLIQSSTCPCMCTRVLAVQAVTFNVSGSVPLQDPLLITTLSWMIYSSLWISCVWFCLSRGTWMYKYNRSVSIGVSFHLCFRNLRLVWGWTFRTCAAVLSSSFLNVLLT